MNHTLAVQDAAMNKGLMVITTIAIRAVHTNTLDG
jgi:hypothetical protein